MIAVKPTGQSCGATITGLDLTKPQEASVMHEVRAAWLEHHVLVFPEQAMSNDDLVRFAEYLGPIGDDPYFKPIDGHDRIAAVQRRADETGILFADSWHGDWSFQVRPPSGTCLLSLTIPPVGGDTQFTNQHMALDEMPAAMREKLEGKTGLHSARRAYANDGKYAEKLLTAAWPFEPPTRRMRSTAIH